jgi:Fur family transcriptional regulator, ferric uptake regulator
MSCLFILKEKGLKLTPQRRLIVDIIHDAKTHITAEEIIANVKQKMPGVNKSTIYRTLDLLEETGCVYKSEAHDQFIYHHAEEGHHHHLVCEHCGKTLECEEDMFGPLEKSLQKRFGFQTEFKHVVIKGICQECRSK